MTWRRAGRQYAPRSETSTATTPGRHCPTTSRLAGTELNVELDTLDETLVELEARRERVADLANREQNTESESQIIARGSRGKKASRVPDDPTDLASYRNLSGSVSEVSQAYRDGAMTLVERMHFAHPDSKRERDQENVERLLDRFDGEARPLARRIIATSGASYKREFTTYLMTRQPGPEMQRAVGIGSQGGGYPVPIDLDPTVILTSSGVINPVRQIARVVQTTGNVWEGVSSAGVVASYAG